MRNHLQRRSSNPGATRSICAACGQPGHRYGRNEGMDRFNPQACINLLNTEIDRLKRSDLYRKGWDDAVKAALNAWHA